MSKKEIRIVYLILAVLIIMFTFLDFKISKTVVLPGTVFGIFFEVIGESPSVLTLIVCFMALLITRNHGEKWKNVLSIILYSLFIAASAFILFLLINSFLLRHVSPNMINQIVLSVLIVLAILFLFFAISHIKKDKFLLLRRLAKFGIVLAISQQVVVTVLKIIWKRARYRTMAFPPPPDFSIFTRWYIPFNNNPNESSYWSFPSGHTSNASVILCLILIPYLIPQFDGKERFFKIIAFSYILLVAVSRVLEGAHFASDVTMGFCVTFTLFIILERAFHLNTNERERIASVRDF